VHLLLQLVDECVHVATGSGDDYAKNGTLGEVECNRIRARSPQVSLAKALPIVLPGHDYIPGMREVLHPYEGEPLETTGCCRYWLPLPIERSTGGESECGPEEASHCSKYPALPVGQRLFSWHGLRSQKNAEIVEAEHEWSHEEDEPKRPIHRTITVV
jgi:hypothetical protein